MSGFLVEHKTFTWLWRNLLTTIESSLYKRLLDGGCGCGHGVRRTPISLNFMKLSGVQYLCRHLRSANEYSDRPIQLFTNSCCFRQLSLIFRLGAEGGGRGAKEEEGILHQFNALLVATKSYRFSQPHHESIMRLGG